MAPDLSLTHWTQNMLKLIGPLWHTLHIQIAPPRKSYIAGDLAYPMSSLMSCPVAAVVPGVCTVLLAPSSDCVPFRLRDWGLLTGAFLLCI